jgi:hypothetical protein
MQFRIKFAIIVVAIFAISHHCLACTSKAKALSGDDVDYLASLINDCWDDDPMCGVKEGKFTVHLHEEHKSSHLEFTQRIVHVDPFKGLGVGVARRPNLHSQPYFKRFSQSSSSRSGRRGG